jgi:hypothetical protein
MGYEHTETWFDRLFAEFSGRGEAMFAFSRSQVEEHGVDWDVFQSDAWTARGAGLYVKTSALPEWVRRMEADHAADQATLPQLRVRHIGTDHWDRHLYRDEAGRTLADVSLSPANQALELHTLTAEGEPISALRVRLVFEEQGS